MARITFYERFKHLYKKRQVTSKTRHHGVMSFVDVYPRKNPKYGDLDYKDPRSDEVYDQEYLGLMEVLVNFDQRLRSIESYIKRKEGKT